MGCSKGRVGAIAPFHFYGFAFPSPVVFQGSGASPVKPLLNRPWLNCERRECDNSSLVHLTFSR